MRPSKIYANLNWPEIQADYDALVSWKKISEKHKTSEAALAWGIKHGLLKPKPNRRAHAQLIRNRSIETIKDEVDWAAMQVDYDNLMTLDGICKKYGSSIDRGVRFGKIKKQPNRASVAIAKSQADKPRTHSEETKRKLSLIRRQFIALNPDKVPYLLNHSSRKSYPEKRFESALMAHGITGWAYAFQAGIYEYDFAFPEQKIDVEIDGGTHLTEKVKQIDKRRDEWSCLQGWRVIRFTASRVKKDVNGCIEELKQFMNP